MNDINKALDSMFAFKPGDLVGERACVAALKAEAAMNGPRDYGRVGTPVPMIVAERLVAQCHGGVQGFYLVNEKAKDGAMLLNKYPDHALVPFDEIVAATALNAAKAKEG